MSPQPPTVPGPTTSGGVFSPSPATNPVVVYVTSAAVLVNALLVLLVAFVELGPAQTAGLFGVVNPAAALAIAVWTRGKVSPTAPG